MIRSLSSQCSAGTSATNPRLPGDSDGSPRGFSGPGSTLTDNSSRPSGSVESNSVGSGSELRSIRISSIQFCSANRHHCDWLFPAVLVFARPLAKRNNTVAVSIFLIKFLDRFIVPFLGELMHLHMSVCVNIELLK